MDPHSPMQGGPFPPPITPYNVAEIWSLPDGAGDPRRGHFGQNLRFLETSSRDLPVEESTVTEQSGSRGGGRKRRDATAAVSEDDSSKLASTSGGNDMTDSSGKRLKVAGLKEENEDSKAEVEASSGNGNKLVEQSAQSSEAAKQDYIHVRARRGQATDSHSLAERARREKISERMKILQDLVPGCNKVIGKALVLDEIINYIQSLQRQVEFLSMKLEAVNSRINASTEGFPAKDFGMQTFDTAGMALTSQSTREYVQGSAPEWLHRIIGSSLRWLVASRGVQSARITGKVQSKLHAVMNSSSLPAAPQPPSPNPPSWASWILGSLLSIVLPLLKLKGGFLQIIGKVEQVVDMVEDVVEAVEDVAEVVEHVADKVGDSLPDNTPLKCVALWVEDTAKEVGDDVEHAKDFIDKVQDLTDEVEKKVDQLQNSFTGDEGEAVQKKTNTVGLKEEVEQTLVEQREQIVKEEVDVKGLKQEVDQPLIEQREQIVKEEVHVKEVAS